MTITMTREEAQQVLDALEVAPYMSNKDDHEHLQKAIETFRARLAQPEPEPVAWCIVENGRIHGLVKSKPAVMNSEKWQPLYTAPPQREWVGLTDEEANELTYASIAEIEAKLKEKNYD